MIRGRCRPRGDRRRGDDPRPGRGDPGGPRPRPRRAALDRACAPGPPRRRVGHQLGPAVRRLADVLRAARRDGTGRPGLRGLPLRRLGPARLRRPSPRVEPKRPDLRRHPRPRRSCSRSARTGAPGCAASPRSTSSRCPSRRCGRCWPAWCRACRSRPSGRSSPAPTACRSTRSRPCGCSSPRAGWPSRMGPTTRSATWRASRCPRRSRRSSPRGSTASRPDDRALVSDAAVLGQSFTPAGLGAVSGLGRGRAGAAPALARAPRAPGPRGRPAVPERGQYAFVQALIREVAYNTLAKRDRKVRHLAAARFFEALGSDELAGALAGHYLAAHQNAARRTRGRGAGGAGPDRPARGGPAGPRPRRPGAGRDVPRPGACRDHGRGRDRRAPRGGRRGGRRGGPQRRGRGPATAGRRAAPRAR